MTTAYPLAWPDGWPRTKYRNPARFQVTFDVARNELKNQLRLMGAANDCIISSNLPLRRNGEAYADDATVNLEDPGVAIYFVRKGKQMVMARDAYKTVLGNLRSVGLAVEHLRGLERHGGAPMLERAFEGFARLSHGGPTNEPSCWEILDVKPGCGRETILERFRLLAKDAHPDLGGTAEAFARLKKARDEAMAGGRT
jgi:hypothetical protein